MDVIQKTLEKFGLTENEAIIYREALKHTESSPYTLSRTTGIPRTTVYEIVMSLSLKGLIELERSDGFTKQQTKLRAKNPSELRKLLWQKRKALTSLEVDIVNILPMLKADYHKSEANADFQFFPGLAGAKKVYISETEDDVDLPSYIWDYQIPMDAFGAEFVNDDVIKGIERKKVLTHKPKELFPLTDWSKHVLTYQYQRNPAYIAVAEHRFIENPIWDIKQRIVIKDNHIRIINVEHEETWGIIINSPSLAKSFTSMFLFMWQLATPVTEQIIQGWGENAYLAEEQQKRR